eukprot:GEMP01016736.1.p1 GENE.GEMP01016736.1~~GEMP01016736.1.p1  ORF type:complete len:540 (+),score=129.09 GEMP01016736.1:179-1798(+)
MVLLSVAIVSRNKTLLARQFVDMSRIRIEGILSTFPKLLDSGKDHTFIETETVRYVYQPVEQLYLVVVTNKTSIIMEDLETLKLLAKVVQETCGGKITEELVVSKAFDLIFAFDEVVSFGYRENVTMAQITSYIEMDSHEEKLARMIELGKLNAANEAAKKRAGELKKMKMGTGKEMAGIGSAAFSGGGKSGGVASSATEEEQQFKQQQSVQQVMAAVPLPASTWGQEEDTNPSHAAKMGKKGLSLGAKKPVFEPTYPMGLAAGVGAGMTMAQAEAPNIASYAPEEAAPVPLAANPLKEPVSVNIEEQITANLHSEGGINGEIEVQGKFDIIVFDQKADQVCFELGDLKEGIFKYKGNPVLNKQSQAKGLLEPKDPSKPAYAPNILKPLLKWLMKSKEEEHVPISLSCWPSPTPDGANVVLEYELTNTNVTLTDVHVRFPCPAHARANIESPDQGQAEYDNAAQQIHWYIPRIDSDDFNGTLEFTASCDSAQLMPFTFTAESQQLMAPVGIKRCYHQTRDEDLNYALKSVARYGFTIGA